MDLKKSCCSRSYFTNVASAWGNLFIQKMQMNWTASSEFGTYRLCEQRRFRRACASAQSRQNLRCSLIEAVSQEEPSDRKPDPWPLWMAGHAQLKCVMTECSKTQIRLTGLNWQCVEPDQTVHLKLYVIVFPFCLLWKRKKCLTVSTVYLTLLASWTSYF